MLESLKRKRRLKRLAKLLEADDLKLWPKVREELQPEDLTEPLHNGLCALEICCQTAHSRLLQELLHQFPQYCNWLDTNNNPLYMQAFVNHERGLGLLSAMLSCGLDPNTVFAGRSLIEHGIRCEPKYAMLLISRLAQHNADLNNSQLVREALSMGEKALVKFLIDSGAPIPEISGNSAGEMEYTVELLSFAKRCAEDKKLRDLWR